jgi:hypothetical protein
VVKRHNKAQETTEAFAGKKEYRHVYCASINAVKIALLPSFEGGGAI